MSDCEEKKVRIGFGGKVVRAPNGKFTFIVLVDTEGQIFQVNPPAEGWPVYPNADSALNACRKIVPKFVAGNAGEYTIAPYFEDLAN